MHEATLAASVLRIAEQAMVGKHGRVSAVRVSVGALAGVMPDAMAFAFDALKKNTPLKQASLVLLPEPAAARCDACGREYEPEGFPYTCLTCGSHNFRIIGGEDVYVKELELET